MKSLFKFVALIMIASMLLTACAAPANQTQQPAQGAGTEATQPAAGGDTGAAAGGSCAAANGQTVEMWSPLTGPDGDEMTALANRYSQENADGITVKHIAQPEYIQKLNAAAAAKKMPTMTVVRATNVAELAERGVLLPMSDEVLGIFGADVGSDFPEGVWNAGLYEGQRYSFPLDVHPLVMYYNKELFQAAGVEEPGTEPWTREEFESALEKLNKDGVAGIAIGTVFQASALFQSFIVQFGGSLASEDGTQVTFNSDAGVQAANYIKELKDANSPDISGAGDPEVNVFKQQKAAIVIHGPWHISDLQKLPWVGFAPIPQVGDKFAVWAGSHQLGITNADPAQQVAAACWIKWLSENSAEWAKAGQVPVRNSIRESEELKTVAAPIAAVAPAAADAILLPQAPELEGALWGQGFEPATDAYFMGESTDIKAALDDAAAKSQQLLEESKAKYE